MNKSWSRTTNCGAGQGITNANDEKDINQICCLVTTNGINEMWTKSSYILNEFQWKWHRAPSNWCKYMHAAMAGQALPTSTNKGSCSMMLTQPRYGVGTVLNYTSACANYSDTHTHTILV